MATGWPLDSSRYDGNGNVNPWFLPSDIDIGVPESHQHLYQKLLAGGLETLERRETGRQPDLAVIVCGADPYEQDELPSASLLQLSRQQLLERNDFLWRFFRQRQIPSVWLMAGGYGAESHIIDADFLQASLTQTLNLF